MGDWSYDSYDRDFRGFSIGEEMARFFLLAGSITGLLGVGFGAFGAHALRAHLDDYSKGVFKTAVDYQFWHALALLAVGLLLRSSEHSILKLAGYAFLFGIIFFSGSLYTLALTQVKAWGAVTPIGGVAFLIGWGLLAYYAWEYR